MARDYLQDALSTFNGGMWYGWKTHDDKGNKIAEKHRSTAGRFILSSILTI